MTVTHHRRRMIIRNVNEKIRIDKQEVPPKGCNAPNNRFFCSTIRPFNDMSFETRIGVYSDAYIWRDRLLRKNLKGQCSLMFGIIYNI